jgi:ribonuclease-3
MNAEYSPEHLQDLIGYTFTDIDLLKGALTRFKYLDDQHVPTDNNMDPLATVGDAVLDLVVLQRLYENGCRDTGVLSTEKEKVIAKANTRALADGKKYHKYVQWDSSEEDNTVWESADETLDRCIEALIGAVYLDAQRSGKNDIAAVDDMLVQLGFSLP